MEASFIQRRRVYCLWPLTNGRFKSALELGNCRDSIIFKFLYALKYLWSG